MRLHNVLENEKCILSCSSTDTTTCTLLLDKKESKSDMWMAYFAWSNLLLAVIQIMLFNSRLEWNLLLSTSFTLISENY